jgi:succinate-acetate transporter protein
VLILGGIAQIFWSLSAESDGTRWFGTAGVCFGVFVASVCAVALLPRIAFTRFLVPAIFWTIIGFLMRMTGFGHGIFGLLSDWVVCLSGFAAIVGVLLGLGVRKLVAPR